MKPTITCGPQIADNANLAGSHFHNVNLADSTFDDINFSGTTFHDINFSDIAITAVQLGGARFKHVGLPPDSGRTQRPLSFEECDLNHSTITRCDLSGVEITACQLSGMKIDDILVTDLLAAHAAKQNPEPPRSA